MRMKRMVCFAVILVCSVMFSVSAYAQAAQDGGLLESSGAGELYDDLNGETKEILNGLGIDGVDADSLFNVSLSSVFNVCKNILTESLKAPLLFMMKLLGALLLITAAKSAGGTLGGGSDVPDLFGVMLATVMCVSAVGDCLNAIITSIDVCHSFLLAYVPVFAVIVSVSGNAATALTYNSVVLTAAELISSLSSSVFVPCAGIFMSLSIAFSLNSTLNAQRLAAAINKIIFFFVGLCSSLFAAMLSLKSIMTVSVDSVTSKGVRMLFSSLIPVVGGAISEAYSSIVGSLGIIRSTVAVFGIVALLAVNLPVLFQAALYGVSLNLLSFASDSMNQSGISAVFRCMSCTIKIVAVILVLQMFILIISTGILIVMKGNA